MRRTGMLLQIAAIPTATAGGQDAMRRRACGFARRGVPGGDRERAMRSARFTALAAAGHLAIGACAAGTASAAGMTVLRAPGAPNSFREELAARELRRYICLRTGTLPTLATAASCEGVGLAAATAARLGSFVGVPADVLAGAGALKPGE